MNTLKFIGVLLAAGIASALPASANASYASNGAVGSAVGEEIVRLDFSALSLGDYLSGVRYVTMGEVRELAVNNGSRSARQVYVGPPIVTFFREKAAADGAVVREVIGSVNLRDRKGPLLLLFDDGRFTGSEGRAEASASAALAAPQMRILAMGDDLDSFPEGSYRLLNMTGDPLAVSVAGDVVNIGARSAATVDAVTNPRSVSGARSTLDVIIGRFDSAESAWVRVYESKWPYASGQRTLVLLYSDARRPDGIGVRRIAQMLELPASLLQKATVAQSR